MQKVRVSKTCLPRFSCCNFPSFIICRYTRWYGIEGTAVEVFQDGQLVGPGVVGGAAGGDVLDVDGQAVAAVGAAKCGGHGAGVAPGVEDLIQ